MGRWQRLVDWLGNRLDGDDTGPYSVPVDPSFDVERARFMELARAVMVDYLTSALQLCEMKFYERGVSDPTRDDAYLWNVSPNPNQDHSAFMTQLMERIFIDEGEALVVPVRSGTGMSIYIADGYNRQENPGAADIFTDISIEGSLDVVPYPMTMDEVFWFDCWSMGAGWRELLSKVSDIYNDVLTVVLQATADRNGRKWILRKDRPAGGTKDEQEHLEKLVKEGISPFVRSTTGVVVLNKGEELERASLDSGRFSGMNAKDIANIRTDMFAVAAACFRMPTSMLEGNAANFEQVFQSFLTFAVDPVARAISNEVTRKCFTRAEWAKGAKAQMDTTRIKHVDLFDSADKIEKLLGSSIDSANEIRGFTGQDPIDEPWADEYLVTKNFGMAGGGEIDGQETDAASGE